MWLTITGNVVIISLVPRGSAGIGRQAGLRCLCPTIDVRVQVPSPAPKSASSFELVDFYFPANFEYWIYIVAGFVIMFLPLWEEVLWIREKMCG